MWPSWPGDPVDPVKNPVATRWLFFLLKQRRFDFFKKINPGKPVKTQWPGQNLEPGPGTGPTTEPGLKTMGINNILNWKNIWINHNW